jgi:hut operon positive regulatory protein
MVAGSGPGFLENSVVSPGTAVMLLAMTQTIYDEDMAKQLVAKKGFKAVVTEVGGKTSFYDFNERINRAVIGACLNSGIIEKTSNDIHAVIHATEEAKKGLLVSVSTSASLAMKIAVARNEHWIAVALFGKSALHYMTNHERAGLGIMHI